MKLSFQTRIALFFSVLFIAVQALTIFFAYRIFYANAVQQLNQNLVYAEQLFAQFLTERGERIASEARILVADFGFRTTVSEGDPKTITSALQNLVIRIRGQQAFWVDLSGKIVADTTGRFQATDFAFPEILAQAEQQGRAVAFGMLDGVLYEWVVAPVLAPVPIGWVVIALAIDHDQVGRLRQMSSLTIEFSILAQTASQTWVLNSSLPAERQLKLAVNWPNLAQRYDQESKIMTLDALRLVTQWRHLPTADSRMQVLAVLQIDLNQALQPYWLMIYAALGVLMAALILILTGCFFIARSLSQPLKALAGASERFMDGELTPPLPVSSQDELGRLAKTFNRAAELANQMHALKQKDQVRREMVATVSHDFRNPLAALHGFLQTLQIKSGSLPEQEQQRFLAVALRQSEKVGRLAQEFFELAKLECDETNLTVEDFSIAELIQDVAQKFQLSARQKNVELLIPIRQGLPHIAADIGLIERLLTNLLDNALKHTSSGGQIQLEACSDFGLVQVSVKDTGSGIPAEYLPTLFDWESPLSYRARADAGGFGLVIVAKILRLHGGTIEVESCLGQGSEFRFSLPINSPAASKPT